jgi:tricarballylate dehydrogenase
MAAVAARRMVVVGGGNAALCSALAAADSGAQVTVLEAAPEKERGGNSVFTAGAMRFAYESPEQLLQLVPDLGPDRIAETDFGGYPRNQFLDDLARITEYHCDPDMAETLVERSYDTLEWMRTKGIRFLPIYGRQAFKIDGRFRFWGGLVLEVKGGRPGLIDSLYRAAAEAGIDVRCDHRALELIVSKARVTGVKAIHDGRELVFDGNAVVLASGGFQANTEWRTRYLGPLRDLARVRGTRFNIGQGIKMALDIGAMSFRHWSGCHAVAWDYNAPLTGDLSVGDGFQKHSYPWCIMLNNDGVRFVDEGADFRNYTYAEYGRAILYQPGQVAWQVFDQKISHLLRDEYRIRQVTTVGSHTIEGLARKMPGMNVEQFVRTVEDYNRAVLTNVLFNPNVLDGRAAPSLPVPKSNWANTIDQPPYRAYGLPAGSRSLSVVFESIPLLKC